MNEDMQKAFLKFLQNYYGSGEEKGAVGGAELNQMTPKLLSPESPDVQNALMRSVSPRNMMDLN